MYKVTNEVEKKIIELAIIKARTTNKLLPDYNDIINSTIDTLASNKDEFQGILNSVNEYKFEYESKKIEDYLAPYYLTTDITGSDTFGYTCNVISTIDNCVKFSSETQVSKLEALLDLDIIDVITKLNI